MKILDGRKTIYPVSDFFFRVTLNNFLGNLPSSNSSIFKISNPFENNSNAFVSSYAIPPTNKVGYTYMNFDGAFDGVQCC